MAMIKHHTGIAEMVGQLLERLELAKELVPQNSEFEKFINQISTEIVKIKYILDSRETFDERLVDYIQSIARKINPLINLNKVGSYQMDKVLYDLPQMIATQTDPWINLEPHEMAYDSPQGVTITEVGESSNTSYQMNEEVTKVEEFKDLLESLGIIESYCMKSLSMFPANTKLKKRLVIYWWYGLLGIEGSKRLFSRLINKKVLIPVHRDHNKAIDHFTIEPTVYRWLISNSEGYGRIASMQEVEGTWKLLSGEPRGEQLEILLNLDQGYPHSRDIMDVNSKHNNVGVIQLGRWCYTELEIHNEFGKTGSEVTMSEMLHIEVDETDFLKKLNKKVRYLSLCGISGITELHESVGKLKDLIILDLRACHNLEILPQKPRSTLIQKLIRWKFSIESGWFKKLQVLDISECYLLDHMPKWICELSNLVVLKGFVVGGLENKNQSCLLCDLSKLNNLEKLSIRIIPNCILGPEDFHGFDYLDSLLVLTITWGQNQHKEIPIYSLPKNLEKLDMRHYPEVEASKWKNREELKKLKRLYIRGGNLVKIPCHDNWKVEILRLRFLKKLVPTDWNEVRSSFKYLKYVEYVRCPRPRNFPNDCNSWRNEE